MRTLNTLRQYFVVSSSVVVLEWERREGVLDNLRIKEKGGGFELFVQEQDTLVIPVGPAMPVMR
jgi:hypothetical protein